MGLLPKKSQGSKESERKPSPILNLPFDVLLHISTFLPPRYLSVLTRTCRALRRALAPELVNRPVPLTADNMASFSAFMHTSDSAAPICTDADEDDDGTRFSLLRSVRIDPVAGHSRRALSPAQMAHAIKELLQRARSLTRLSLSEVSYAFSPRQIRTALALLPALESVSLGGLTGEYTSVLADVRAPLRSVTLHTGRWNTPDALACVAQHHATLEVLSFRLGGESFALPDDPEFPVMHRVRELRFGWLAGGEDATRNLMRLFPNARRVRIDAIAMSRVLLINPASDAARERRAAGKALQQKSQPEECWTKLDVLSVRSLAELYFLALPCAVAHLNVRAIGGDGGGIGRVVRQGPRALSSSSVRVR
ncbi:hypothetical protein OH77DRAFT_676112 [Trametes cingulata]|nr:hypothetical protein OH77DRAFT_676112 [Trametes cingulata]